MRAAAATAAALAHRCKQSAVVGGVMQLQRRRDEREYIPRGVCYIERICEGVPRGPSNRVRALGKVREARLEGLEEVFIRFLRIGPNGGQSHQLAKYLGTRRATRRAHMTARCRRGRQQQAAGGASRAVRTGCETSLWSSRREVCRQLGRIRKQGRVGDAGEALIEVVMSRSSFQEGQARGQATDFSSMPGARDHGPY